MKHYCIALPLIAVQTFFLIHLVPAKHIRCNVTTLPLILLTNFIIFQLSTIPGVTNQEQSVTQTE
jgi:hypothetical protein